MNLNAMLGFLHSKIKLFWQLGNASKDRDMQHLAFVCVQHDQSEIVMTLRARNDVKKTEFI